MSSLQHDTRERREPARLSSGFLAPLKLERLNFAWVRVSLEGSTACARVPTAWLRPPIPSVTDSELKLSRAPNMLPRDPHTSPYYEGEPEHRISRRRRSYGALILRKAMVLGQIVASAKW